MEYFYTLLLTYKYLILLPIAIIEGPIIIIIASFLASQGILNIFVVYVIAVLGNVIGDCIYYSVGRIGRYTFIAKYGHYIGITSERIKSTEEHYKNHFLKTLIIAKITEAPVVPTLVAAGVSRVDARKFVLVSIALEMVKAVVIVLIGYYFGKFYVKIDGYFKDSILAFGIIFVLLILLIIVYKKIKAKKV